MKIEIKKEVFTKLNKGFLVGGVIVNGMDNKRENAEITELLRDVVELVKLISAKKEIQINRYISTDRVDKLEPEYKHKDTRLEVLMQKVIKEGHLKGVNKLVDLCNFIGLKYFIPCGCHDLAKIKGNLKYGIFSGSEKIKKNSRLDKSEKGVLILSDGAGIISEKFEFQESHLTKCKRSTKDAIILIEVTPPIKKQKLKRIVEEIADLIKIFLRAKVKDFVLDEKNTGYFFTAIR